jgi:hypothetical protein
MTRVYRKVHEQAVRRQSVLPSSDIQFQQNKQYQLLNVLRIVYFKVFASIERMANQTAPRRSTMPEDVLQMESPAQGYLCPLDANVYGVEFLKFEVRDYDTGKPVYMVSGFADWMQISSLLG